MPHIKDIASNVNLMNFYFKDSRFNFQRFQAIKSDILDKHLSSHKSSIRELNDPSVQVGVMGEFYYQFVINKKTQSYLVITSTKVLFDRKCAILCGNDAALLGLD